MQGQTAATASASHNEYRRAACAQPVTQPSAADPYAPWNPPGAAHAAVRIPVCLAALVLLSLALAMPLATASSFAYDARYDIRKGPFTLGETALQLQRPAPERYRYRLHTHAIGIAALFLTGETFEISEGRVTKSGFRPELYRYRRTGDARARDAELHFDWKRGQVVNDVGRHPWRMAITADTKDRLAGPLQLMYDLEHGRTASVYHIADGGKLKTYTMHIEGRDTIRTPLGRFETVRVIQRAQEDDSITRIWCAPALHYLAVRIERRDRENGAFTLVLRALRDLTPSAVGHTAGDTRSRPLSPP
ncbi:MAG TPA: DUF3108 domain-containing protein [Nitrococcus sp.]|nr:DUF3108 domain-containing protein [Nitrococcus sp.]